MKKKLMWAAQLVGLGGFGVVFLLFPFSINSGLMEECAAVGVVFFAIYLWGRQPWRD